MSRPILVPVRAAIALMLVLSCWKEAAAQRRYIRIAAEHSRPILYHEAIILPGDKPQAVITFRIPNSLLIFVREKDGFVANVEAGVEVFRGDEKQDERMWRGEQRVSSFDATKDRMQDLEGEVYFTVEPGSYSYRLRLSGDVAAPGARTAPRPFDVPDFDSSVVGAPFFVTSVSRAGGMIEVDAVNLGGAAPYGERAHAAVPVVTFGSDPELSYRLYRISDARSAANRSEDDGGTQEPYELQPDDLLIAESSVSLDDMLPAAGLEPGCLCWSAEGAGSARLAIIDLETTKLENATYLFDVTLSSDVETLHRRDLFRTHWRNMPLSLYDLEVAIRNLTFIEGRDTVRELLGGSREDQIRKFRDYWSRRDPSPGTAFNELMDEYYRRVDHAAFEFRSGTEPYPDGLATDAARIFIIHGEPDDVSSTFPSSGGVEQIWAYADGRRFVFRAASSLEPLVLQESSATRRSAVDGD